ncbi:MAG: hypothetical protein COT74_03255 [Bdellovibrionales bacterium CG10_big_fil_rev_8_21_14_0_10_45_34]|nr:MAG: hypothetical protein COT74_03255 [Bdellovibrionales bacterium CG10_big_fil_rev_8_21_14_0_10_45_34]
MVKALATLILLMFTNQSVLADVSRETKYICLEFVDSNAKCDVTHLASNTGQAENAGEWKVFHENYSLGYFSGTVWLALEFDSSIESGEKVLTVNYPLIDYLDLTIFEDGVEILASQTGALRPLSSRPIQSTVFAFPVNLKPDKHYRMVLKAQSQTAMSFPIDLNSKREFLVAEKARDFKFGAYSGIILFIVIVNFLLYFVFFEKSLIVYCLAVFSYHGFAVLSLFGYPTVYLWPDNFWLIERQVALSECLAVALSLMFALKYLRLKRHSEFLHKVFLTCIGTSIFLAVLAIWIPGQITLMLAAGISVLAASLSIWTGSVLAIKRKSRMGLFYLVGWTVLCLTTMLFLAQYLGLVAENIVTVNAIFVGGVFEASILAYGLGDRFRRIITEKIASQQNALTRLRAARARQEEILNQTKKFVPSGLVELLGKSDITSINLGSVESLERTVLFLDIRNFTSVAELMKPTELYQFLLHYLAKISPIVDKYHGFIDKFIGDGILAIFETPEDCMSCALDILKGLEELNRSGLINGLAKVQVGFGIHTGVVAAGVIGNPMRLEATVVGDTVNVAARLESTTKEYGCEILISKETYLRAPESLLDLIRFVDVIQLKGKSKTTEIYQLIDPDHVKDVVPNITLNKLISLIKDEKVSAAKQLCQELEIAYPKDRLIQNYRTKIHLLNFKSTTPDALSGVPGKKRMTG